MAVISTLITEMRTDLSDDDSTRWTDTKMLNMIKKAIRRANRIIQRNGFQFGKKKAELTTVAAQSYLTLSTSVTDFDVFVGMWRTGTHEQIPLRTEAEWEEKVTAAALEEAMLDYQNDKILFQAAPDAAETIDFWYYPAVDPSAYTTASSTPWSGRIDDIIMGYASNCLRNVDEMDVSMDLKLMADMETQLIQAYMPNAPMQVEGKGWMN